ncbi:SDR family oxidoreductase [Aureivirga sp. CE67]|uniref:SDR family oxidoreductase n=1 Tax=Aureivirga sp. CE67 TaxID=1788983 RepID=UPI0018CAFDA3|nr:SDR family oxidoreductase [Aureivirga sp. CE67]
MAKTVLITGGSSGIGKSIGEYLSSKNYKVYGTSRNPKQEKFNDNFHLVALDVSDVDSIEKAVNFIVEKEGKIDILVNNAGIGITGPVEETPMEEIKKAFDTNFFGLLNVCKGVLPTMRKQRDGIIINVSSIAGYMGLPYRGVYSATKGAVSLITEAMSMEVKQFGIKMVDVAPGDFVTNIAAGRYHTPVFKGSDYEEKYGEVLRQIDEEVDTGSDPILMAKAVHHIIENKNPKIHYKVGVFMQKFSIVLKRILPDRMYEKLLMNHYKL